MTHGKKIWGLSPLSRQPTQPTKSKLWLLDHLCWTGHNRSCQRSQKFATVAASFLAPWDFELNQRKFAEPPRIDTWKTLRWAWPQWVKMGKTCFLWSSVGSPCPLIVASKQAAIAYVKSTSWIEMPSCKPSKSDFETLHLFGTISRGNPIMNPSFGTFFGTKRRVPEDCSSSETNLWIGSKAS